MLKALAIPAGMAGGVILAAVEAVQAPVDETTRVYAFALAVVSSIVGLAAIAVRESKRKASANTGETFRPVPRHEWDATVSKIHVTVEEGHKDLRRQITDVASDLTSTRRDGSALRQEITGRFDRIDLSMGKLADSIASFRESAAGSLADHGARIIGAERDISDLAEKLKDLRK